jgi:hypothetical protein
MKKTILFIFALVLGTTFVFADDSITIVSSKNNDAFFIGFGTGMDLPGSGWDKNYTLGGGAQAFAGYLFDKDWALRADVDNWFFEGNSFSLYHLRTILSIKYTFDAKGWQPYLLAGPGIVCSSLLGVSAVNFDALVGLGVQFDLTADSRFFVEGQYNFDLPTGSSLEDIPITAGIWTSL